MIDMHSHIIPMVDDGSKSFSITEKMLSTASSNGITAIFATPHYIDRRSVERKVMLEHFNALKPIAESVGVELILGNEVFVCPEITRLVKEEKVSRMNDTKYLLMELPRNNDVNYLEDVIFGLKDMGVTPIIAHPERYAFVREKPRSLYEFADQGVLFQLNSGSLLGDYGDSVKKVAKLLLKHNVYQFMGTDAHSYDRYKVYHKATEYVSKLVGDDVLKLITETNPNKVKNNEDVDSDLQQIKKSFFFWR